MRIRKRFLSLAAAITTPPSSDLPAGTHNHRQHRVQHQELHPNGNQHALYDNTLSHFPDPPNQCQRPPPPLSSHHTTQIGLQPSTWVPSGDCSHPNNTKIFKEYYLDSVRKTELTTKTPGTGHGKGSILCAEANNHDLVLKGWLQGDRLVPMKKKRGSCGRRLKNDGVQHDEMMIERTLMESKPKKIDKRVTIKRNVEKREGVIMEGSRCSRVNGRGWRCSQQTLVGYSLCEHHLGKGRLRSMTSVCGRAQMVALKEKHDHTMERKDKKAESPSVDDHDHIHDVDNDDDDDDHDDDDEEDDDEDWDVESMSSMEGTKVISKKTKLGVIKARSLSSLLSQISS